jgi:uncharacterized membrane protein
MLYSQIGGKMMKTKTYSLILIIVVVSFLGFCVENIFIGLRHGFIDNRNMILPFLLGYGLSILAYYMLFGTPDKPLFFGKEIYFSSSIKLTFYCFAVAFIGVSIGEIILGYATEWCCDIVWWDYTQIPLHITKYTSVPTSLVFATLITVFMKYCFNPLLSFFSKMNPAALSFLATAMLLVLVLDMINSGIYMFKHSDTLHLWRFDFES